MKRILLIPGSLRAASASRATAKAIRERMQDEALFEFADIGTLPLYNADLTEDPNVAAFQKAVSDADGVIFVTPEYNYSIPGVLKNAIDWGSRPAFDAPFTGKNCFVISISGGALGGVRAQAHLKYILSGMLSKVYPVKEVVVTSARKKVEDGLLRDDAILDFACDAIRGFLDTL
ncbi:NAD(P)H-dependent oxidoreductase [Sulfitobacter sp. D35]|uniref:NADPH-dependent FMN reductase n=1 Tax=Sulfitobacter sp. D35 TaxID=3083252 RepID=UPI00296F5BF4|nr:NAD(P)H-dependent oxidoreductase [Sulfitobacter sp. D35]MDW4498800.1 NAD(P)H-dependent oxidoreductase [Sulfitobacter sp. D35]